VVVESSRTGPVKAGLKATLKGLMALTGPARDEKDRALVFAGKMIEVLDIFIVFGIPVAVRVRDPIIFPAKTTK
jgi:hypothetical protein